MSNSPQTSPDRHPLDVLAEEFAEQCRLGARPSVSDYVRRHPDLAEGLRQVLPPIALMEKLKRRNTSGGAAAAAPPKLDKLGDFRIVREIGRGGMGIVYEAWQESLGRHVALKVLSRASLLDPQRLQRFEREARAAAGLHHTNIVPVFGVGQQESLHYYVMQFIPGRPLSDLLGEFASGAHPGDPTSTRATEKPDAAGAPQTPPKMSPSRAGSLEPSVPPRGKRYWQWVADVGRQVGGALQYAHRQGVLHRDIKPANLLLDGRGAVWITDFGLAKLGELDNVTRTGDVIGTLQYMAPEGLQSQSDARSDVYALGLTLYELLTLRPAFSETSPAALMKRVAEGGLAPPRQINSHIPRDLETIVLKATSRDPAARYATAGALAEDLDNFLHDRPVTARRASGAEKLWRWCRRNRAVAALAALALASALAAIVVGWVAYGMTRSALAAEAARRAQAETSKLAAQAAQRRADVNVALSLKSFAEIFDRIAPPDLLPPSPWPDDNRPPPPRRQQPRDTGQDAAVLQSVLSFYDRFASQNSTHHALEVEAAKAYRRVGDIYLRMGRASDADAANRRAADIYGRLLDASPGSAEYQAGYADAAVWIGYAQAQPDAKDAAALRRGAALAEQLARAAPNDPDDQLLLARMLFREAMGDRQTKDLAGAEEKLRRSVGLWAMRVSGRRLRRQSAPPPTTERAGVMLALGEVLIDQGKTDAARRELALVLDELARPSGGPPRGPGDRLAMASAYQRVSLAAARAGDTALSQQAQDSADRFQRGGPSQAAPEGLRDDRPPPPPPGRGP